VAQVGAYDETIVLPRAVRFPVELLPPSSFDPERLETWPSVAGRLEFFEGRLLYMPPCGDAQGDTVADVVITLGAWVRAHANFVLGTNEAGMRLAGATRAADVAIWERARLGARTGGLRRTPPVLAVEVAGDDDPEDLLRAKAAWYLAAGVQLVWIVLPETKEVVVLSSTGERRRGAGQRIDEDDRLPGLHPEVRELFTQLLQE
jgi:Uma2 family endonuclease